MTQFTDTALPEKTPKTHGPDGLPISKHPGLRCRICSRIALVRKDCLCTRCVRRMRYLKKHRV